MPAKKAISPSIAGLAREHGITRETVRRMRDKGGVDLADGEAVAAAVAMLKGKAEAATEGPGESYAEAKRRRAISDADFARIRADREAGKVVDLAEVKDAFASLGAEMKSRLLAMKATLVNELAGLDEIGISRVLENRIHELLQGIFEDRKIV